LDGRLALLDGMFSAAVFFADFDIWLDSGTTWQHTFWGLLLQIFPFSSANAWIDLLEPRAKLAQANLSSTKLGQSLRGTHSDPLVHPDNPDPDDPDDSDFFWTTRPGSGQGGGRWCGYPSQSFYSSLHSLGSLAAPPVLLTCTRSFNTVRVLRTASGR